MAAVCLSALLEGQGTPSGLVLGAYGLCTALTFDEGDLCLKRDYSNRQLGLSPPHHRGSDSFHLELA